MIVRSQEHLDLEFRSKLDHSFIIPFSTCYCKSFFFFFKVVKSPRSKRSRFVYKNVQDAIFENAHSK